MFLRLTPAHKATAHPTVLVNMDQVCFIVPHKGNEYFHAGSEISFSGDHVGELCVRESVQEIGLLL